MKILITGASGFIGSHLVRYLADQHTVYGLVREKKTVDDNHQVNFIEIDLSHRDFINELPSGVNTVIHLAQSSRYKEFPEGIEDMIAINIGSTALLLDWARQSGVKHFIFASTANVYGQTGDKFTEQSATVPNSYYGASKLAAEQLVTQYAQYFAVDILRLFTVYGPGQSEMLIPRIIQKIRSREDVYLTGKAGINLAPIYIDDLLNIFSKIIKIKDDINLRIMNVCGNESVSLGQIVSIIDSILDTTTSIHFTKDKALTFIASNDFLFEEIGAFEFTSLAVGLTKTIDV